MISLEVETPAGDSYGTGSKRVTEARLEVQPRHPGPDKTVVSITTRDGWTYRFQQFRAGEPFVVLDRERPDGQVRTEERQCPQSVERFVTAVEGRLRPRGQESEEEAQDAPDTSPVALADGGEEIEECRGCRTDYPADYIKHGRCPRCRMRDVAEIAKVEQDISAHPTVDDPTPRHEYGDRQ